MLRTQMPVICFDESVEMVVQFKMFLITKDHKLIPFGLLQGDCEESEKFVYLAAGDDAFLKACGFDQIDDAIENNYILLKPITSHKCPIGRPFDIVGEDGESFVEIPLFGCAMNGCRQQLLTIRQRTEGGSYGAGTSRHAVI